MCWIVSSQLAGIIIAFLTISIFFIALSKCRADKEFKNKKCKYKIYPAVILACTYTYTITRRPNDFIECKDCHGRYVPTGLKVKENGFVGETEIRQCKKCSGIIFVSQVY